MGWISTSSFFLLSRRNSTSCLFPNHGKLHGVAFPTLCQQKSASIMRAHLGWDRVNVLHAIAQTCARLQRPLKLRLWNWSAASTSRKRLYIRRCAKRILRNYTLNSFHLALRSPSNAHAHLFELQTSSAFGYVIENELCFQNCGPGHWQYAPCLRNPLENMRRLSQTKKTLYVHGAWDVRRIWRLSQAIWTLLDPWCDNVNNNLTQLLKPMNSARCQWSRENINAWKVCF